jgi:hypothetical protein
MVIKTFSQFINEQATLIYAVGSVGKEVEKIQQKLIDLKLLNAARPDGNFGTNTKAAVIAFQKKNELTPDGVVGPTTYPKLMGSSPENKKQVPTSTKTNKNIKDVDLTPKVQIAQSDTFRGLSRDTLESKFAPFMKDLETAIKLSGQMSNATFGQLNALKKNNSLKDSSFIIVNKNAAVASLFDSNYKFVTRSSIVTGVSTGETPLTYEEWANITLAAWKKNPTSDPRTDKWVKENPTFVRSNNTINYEPYHTAVKDNKIKEFPFSYAAAKAAGRAVTPSGAYKLGTGKTHNYAGAPGMINTFHLVDIETATTYPAAVHAYSDAKRGELIKKASGEGVDIDKTYTRIGAGCTNVDRNFIENMLKYKPKYVIILPDAGGTVDVKVTTIKKWSEKLLELGDKCVASLSNLFA